MCETLGIKCLTCRWSASGPWSRVVMTLMWPLSSGKKHAIIYIYIWNIHNVYVYTIIYIHRWIIGVLFPQKTKTWVFCIYVCLPQGMHHVARYHDHVWPCAIIYFDSQCCATPNTEQPFDGLRISPNPAGRAPLARSNRWAWHLELYHGIQRYTNHYSHPVDWLVVWNIFFFPYIGNNHPNWRTPSFFRG